jgi:hypothetical protein
MIREFVVHSSMKFENMGNGYSFRRVRENSKYFQYCFTRSIVVFSIVSSVM